MLLGRVIGTVWATRKDEGIEGMKLLIVQEVDLKEKPVGSFVIAVDTVQAGVGDLVLVTKGSSARQTKLTKDRPVDAVIMAIVENLEFQDEKVLVADYQEREKRIGEALARVAET